MNTNEKPIILNGVIFSSSMLEVLLDWQSERNLLNELNRALVDAIICISTESNHSSNHTVEDSQRIIAQLGSLRKALKTFDSDVVC